MLTTHQLGTISPKGGNMKYYANVQYYQQNGQDADLSFWHGDGAAAMGLGSGPVNMKIAELLSTGVGKNGERCENAGVTEGSNAHRIGTDFTFSVPKSVSLAWLAADDEERMRIWHEDVFPAVRAALDEIEEHAYTIGPNGEREPAKMIFSCHPHLDSRDGDVQLHVHSVGYNMAQKIDGSWGTVRNDAILTKNRIKTIGAGFRNELALNMQQNGGYAFVREPYKNAKGRENGDIYPEVKGVEKKVREIYSKRSKAIGVAMDAGLSKERANLYARTPNEAKAVGDRSHTVYLLNDKANSPDDMKRLQQRTTTFRVIASEPAMQTFVRQAEDKATAEKAVIESDRNAALIEQGRRQAVERQQQHEAAERQRQQAEAQAKRREEALTREGAQRAAEQAKGRAAASRKIGRSI